MKVIELKRNRHKIDDTPLHEHNSTEDDPKEIIRTNSFKKIYLIMNFSTIKEIKDLHKNKYIKDKG